MFRVCWNDLKETLDDMYQYLDIGYGATDGSVSRTDSGFTVELLAPKTKKDKINVGVKGSTLNIAWENIKGTKYNRDYKLPESVDKTAIKAKLEDGVLEIDIPTKTSDELKIPIN